MENEKWNSYRRSLARSERVLSKSVQSKECWPEKRLLLAEMADTNRRNRRSLKDTNLWWTMSYSRRLGSWMMTHAARATLRSRNTSDMDSAYHPGMPWLPQMRVWVHEFVQ